MKRLLLALLMIGFVYVTASGQDIHYSQFYHAPFNINPALTGIFAGDARLMSNYRQQWRDPVDYRTFTMAGDIKLRGKSFTNGFFAAGLAFNHDNSGDGRFQHNNIGANLSYTRRITKRFFATAGFQLSMHQRRFDYGQLTFDNQYDNGF
ncbi:MAG: type IX secretion system membrane protein PorP/SprF, partial [Bacteroidota bacterium]